MAIQQQYSKELRNALLTAYFTSHESGAVMVRRLGRKSGSIKKILPKADIQS